MSAPGSRPEPSAIDATNQALCASVEAVIAQLRRNAPEFRTGRIYENTLLLAEHVNAAAVIHAAGLQAIARVEAAQIIAAAMDRRTAAIQRRNCAKNQSVQ